VVQFVDFGTRVLSTAREIYQSTSGHSWETLELHTGSDDLSRLSNEVESKVQKTRLHKAAGPDDSEAVFLRLCGECKNISSEIHRALEKIGDLGTGKIDLSKKQLATKCILLAVKGVMTEERIKALKDRLDEVREQIKLAVLAFLWYGILRELLSQRLYPSGTLYK
jgi:hypothetical protein